MKEETVRLGDARSCELAILGAEISNPVVIEESVARPGSLDVFLAAGDRLGRLTESSWVAKALEDGAVVHHASVNSVNDVDDPPTIRIRVAVGAPDERYEEVEAAPRSYRVGLAGESNYQDAIGTCIAGQFVDVLHETGNPFDDGALVVKTRLDAKIGYVPRDCWLREAMNREGKGCEARILSINTGPSGERGVVIEVTLNPDGVEQCAYRP